MSYSNSGMRPAILPVHCNKATKDNDARKLKANMPKLIQMNKILFYISKLRKKKKSVHLIPQK